MDIGASLVDDQTCYFIIGRQDKLNFWAKTTVQYSDQLKHKVLSKCSRRHVWSARGTGPLEKICYICLVGRLILFVFSLYCSHRLVIDILVEIDIFGRSERFVWPTK